MRAGGAADEAGAADEGYRPPKMKATPYTGDFTAAERRLAREEREHARVMQSSMLAELRDEFSDRCARPPLPAPRRPAADRRRPAARARSGTTASRAGARQRTR